MKRQKLLAVLGWVVLGGVVMAQAPTPGGIGYSRSTASGVPGGVMAGNVEFRDSSMLGPESLTNGVLTGGASWTQTADFALAANAATYTHNTGAGSFQQTSAAAAIPWASAGINGWFSLTYTTSAVTGTPVCTVPATFALAAQSLAVTAGTYTVVFQAMATIVGDFKIACTSAAAATVTFDTLSLKMVNGGSLTVQGRVLVGNGTAALPSVGSISTPGSGMYFNGSDVTWSVSGAARMGLSAVFFYPATTDTVALGFSSLLFTNAYLSRSIQGSKSKSLTDAAAAVSFVRIAVPTNANMGGDVIFTATSTDGASGSLTRQGRVGFAGADIAGTVTCGVSAEYGAATAYSRANTLLCTVTAVTSTTNCDLQVTCTDNKAAAQTVLFNYRLDMPISNTVTPQ